MFFLLLIISNSLFCTIKAPLITFTQTQTAAEKQMLGEDRSLEKDGWLIASIKTSSSGSEIWEKDLVREEFSAPEDKTIYIALRTLAYLARELREYSQAGFTAEGLDGKIRVNPKISETGMDKAFSKPELKKRIQELIKIANENREIVVQGRLKKGFSKGEKPLNEKQKKELNEFLLLTWYRSVEVGEYYESSPSSWKAKD
ncbi:DUF1318 domain-containing protein [Leptospira perolatii]|uniref:DUF1318 domain-containing protein n=1 Tax=Leptospira perolatii TaxID=2023191 RepID=A0A2M9ZNX2_9LEPT|nr:DUF1318 domain-containing protein [Leptospira perolatii]PJZ73679.1 DUF1318 domain-containing protein [Leptospira perolatii]